MTEYVKHGGSFKTIKDIYVKKGGVWRELVKAWVKHNGTWRLYHSKQADTGNLFTGAYQATYLENDYIDTSVSRCFDTRATNLSDITPIWDTQLATSLATIPHVADITCSDDGVSFYLYYIGPDSQVIRYSPQGTRTHSYIISRVGPSHQGLSIAVSKSGYLYILTNIGRIYQLTAADLKQQWVLRLYENDDTTPETIQIRSGSLCVVHDGPYNLGNYNDWIYGILSGEMWRETKPIVFRANTDISVEFMGTPPEIAESNFDQNAKILVDKGHNIYLSSATMAEVYCFNRLLDFKWTYNVGSTAEIVSDMAMDNNRQLFILTRPSGGFQVHVVSSAGQMISRIDKNDVMPDHPGSVTPTGIDVDPSGLMAIGLIALEVNKVSAGGVFLMRRHDGGERHFFTVPNEVWSMALLPGSYSAGFWPSNEKNLYVATRRTGVSSGTLNKLTNIDELEPINAWTRDVGNLRTVRVDREGYPFINNTARIEKYHPQGHRLWNGVGMGPSTTPAQEQYGGAINDIAHDPYQGHLYYVGEESTAYMRADGTNTVYWRHAVNNYYDYPYPSSYIELKYLTVAINDDRTIVVGDVNGLIKCLNVEGIAVWTYQTNPAGPIVGLEVDSNSNVYFSNGFEVNRIDAGGTYRGLWGLDSRHVDNPSYGKITLFEKTEGDYPGVYIAVDMLTGGFKMIRDANAGFPQSEEVYNTNTNPLWGDIPYLMNKHSLTATIEDMRFDDRGFIYIGLDVKEDTNEHSGLVVKLKLQESDVLWTKRYPDPVVSVEPCLEFTGDPIRPPTVTLPTPEVPQETFEGLLVAVSPSILTETGSDWRSINFVSYATNYELSLHKRLGPFNKKILSVARGPVDYAIGFGDGSISVYDFDNNLISNRMYGLDGGPLTGTINKIMYYDGGYVFGTSQGGIALIYPPYTTVEWHTEHYGSSVMSMSTYGDFIYVGTQDGRISKFLRTSLSWRKIPQTATGLDNPIIMDIVNDSDGNIIFATGAPVTAGMQGNFVVKLSPTGEFMWNAQLNNDTATALTVDVEDCVIAGTGGGDMYKFGVGGNPLWTRYNVGVGVFRVLESHGTQLIAGGYTKELIKFQHTGYPVTYNGEDVKLVFESEIQDSATY